ncbi:MAG: 23S rRNA (pseudouridine(1915)-N(3))-methyltransferase RlmH [Bacilli bacterium]|nr:23S rRNA (pseudouridine(1915)-N(3))-methyltransferase RlmH [Bacilli bacterium]
MIKIICVGKLKEQYLKDAVEEYKKRLSKYTDLEIIEVPDEGLFDDNKTLKIEGESILKHISNKDYIITLEIDGKNISSPELAEKLDNIFLTNNTITFIIGGSLGLDDEIKKLSNYKLSFGKMTFPHQLFRVLLLEQIYRCFKINNNESYHK